MGADAKVLLSHRPAETRNRVHAGPDTRELPAQKSEVKLSFWGSNQRPRSEIEYHSSCIINPSPFFAELFGLGPRPGRRSSRPLAPTLGRDAY